MGTSLVMANEAFRAHIAISALSIVCNLEGPPVCLLVLCPLEKGTIGGHSPVGHQQMVRMVNSPRVAHHEMGASIR